MYLNRRWCAVDTALVLSYNNNINLQRQQQQQQFPTTTATTNLETVNECINVPLLQNLSFKFFDIFLLKYECISSLQSFITPNLKEQ
jgi:hypothetical protein